MKEYIFARPNVVTLKEAMHDAYFRGEVIRCKDCKHRDEQTANCTRFRKDWFVQGNSFCSWAERKEE